MCRIFAFDLYGTLASIRTDEYNMKGWLAFSIFLSFQGAKYYPEELRDSYFNLVHKKEKALKDKTGDKYGEIELTDVFKALYNKKGIQCSDALLALTAQVFRAVTTTQPFRLYEGTREMLTALKFIGAKVVLLSNAQWIFTEPELKTVGILDVFDKIFISSEEGFKKPSLSFYDKLITWAADLGIPPNEIMMIGNGPTEDIIPARRLGLKTCFIRSELTEFNASTPNADIIFDKVNMLQLLQELQNYVTIDISTNQN